MLLTESEDLTLTDLRTRLRETRKAWNWTQDELARQSGVGVATIRRFEGDKFDPRLDTARRLAGALHVRVEWLLTGSQPMIAQEMIITEQCAQYDPAFDDQRPGGMLLSGPGGPWYRDGEQWLVDTEWKA